MKFFKYITCILIAVLTSFYLFPFTFRFLPIANTKMILAGVGLVLYIINLSKGRTGSLDKTLFLLSIAALLVSFIACVSAIVNNSNDYTYADYIISMWVWLGGAYTVINIIKLRHGYLEVDLVYKYLLSVCVLQCLLALIIDSNMSFKALVDSMVADLGFIQMDRLEDSNRLYGIGCSLDVVEETLKLHDGIINRKYSSIPRVKGDIGEYSYEVLRLDDVKGVAVGSMTQCCFTVKGAGYSSLKHALTSPNGRILVVKKDGSLVAHSWLWRNGNVLCLDNIEVIKEIKEIDFLDVYLKFAEDVTKKSLEVEGNEKCIQNVMLGVNSFDQKIDGINEFKCYINKGT